MNRASTQGTRENESVAQSRKRKSKDKERRKAARLNETPNQHNKRIQRQKSRSQANRAKNKIDKRSSSGIYSYLRSIVTQSGESNQFVTPQNVSEDTPNKNADSTLPFWPEPIPRSLKNSLLQNFVEQMTMSALAETICAVCHVRAPVKKTKKLPISKIPGLHLLVVSQDIKDLIITSHSSNSRGFSASAHKDTNSVETGQTLAGNHLYQWDSCICNSILFVESSSYVNVNLPYFFNETNSMLYSDGLFKQCKTWMSTVCCKCYDSLSNESIPKFAAANGVWLGAVPSELRDLTIPEEKLISLYRHNSCIIKLHSPFHSATTAQAALKGNCITFLQNLSSVATSLPLALDDLCETLKVIFVGSQPPKRLQLKRVLTVRKKKICRGSTLVEEIQSFVPEHQHRSGEH